MDFILYINIVYKDLNCSEKMLMAEYFILMFLAGEPFYCLQLLGYSRVSLVLMH